MLEKSFGLLFYLKQSKNQKKGPLYIYLKITVDGKPVELSSKRKWEPAKWNSSTARAVGTKEDAKELNHFLDALELQIFQAKRSLVEAGREVSAQAIKDILTGNVEKRKKILEVFSVHNAQMKELQGIDFAHSTMQRYNISYKPHEGFYKMEVWYR